MKYKFHPKAEEEYLNSVKFYESRIKGLGAGFIVEFEKDIKSLLENPELAVKMYAKGIRGKTMSRFPYIIFYKQKDDVLQILSIAHTSRRPGYWRYRSN